ncbi:MAG: hypothetical protein ACE5JG_10700, partial [Planctomycetota bacterium]
HVSEAVRGRFWICAVGSRSESVVSGVVAAAGGANLPRITSPAASPGSSGPALESLAASAVVASHREALEPGHVALGLVTHTGLRALGGGMPRFGLAGLGRPRGFSFTLDVRDRALLELRMSR